MERIIRSTIKPYLVVVGLATAGVLLLAVVPEKLGPLVFRFPVGPDNLALLRHWGLTVGLVGVLMVLASRCRDWVFPVMLIAGIEKLFIVLLHFTSATPLLEPAGLALDSFGAVYSLLYFLVLVGRKSTRL